MPVAKRIRKLLTENNCNGAFNADDDFQDKIFAVEDFTLLRAWLSHGHETEIVSSESASFLFEDGMLQGIAVYKEEFSFPKDTSYFKPLRGKNSEFSGALLDGFL